MLDNFDNESPRHEEYNEMWLKDVVFEDFTSYHNYFLK